MIGLILAGLVALEALYIMVLEMFMPAERQAAVFGLTPEVLKLPEVRKLLGNQGIYNGALGLLIILVLFLFPQGNGVYFLAMLMAYVVIVAIYGGVTVNKRIMLVQGLPALLALLALLFI